MSGSSCPKSATDSKNRPKSEMREFRPIFISPSLSTPSQVSAQLTFDGTAGTTYYYSTSALRPGDIMQIRLQATNATTLDTGSYPYTMTIADIRSSNTTFTYTGNATVENAAEAPTFSALGAGWTVSGLEKIIPATKQANKGWPWWHWRHCAITICAASDCRRRFSPALECSPENGATGCRWPRHA